MFQIKNIFSIFIWSVLCVSIESIEIPNKCPIKDGACKKELFQSLIIQAIEGDSSLDIPKSDPMALIKSTTSLSNSFKLTLEEGVSTGFKACHFDQWNTYLDEPIHSIVNLTCDVQINGKYTVEVPKSVIQEIGGEDTGAELITGSGNGKVMLNGVHINLNLPFKLEWKDNDVYLIVTDIYIDSIIDKVLFTMDGLDVGSKVNEEKISTYLKDHASEFNIMDPVNDGVKKFYWAFVKNYLGSISAKQIYSDNL